jgi:hypothetical protein
LAQHSFGFSFVLEGEVVLGEGAKHPRDPEKTGTRPDVDDLLLRLKRTFEIRLEEIVGGMGLAQAKALDRFGRRLDEVTGQLNACLTGIRNKNSPLHPFPIAEHDQGAVLPYKRIRRFVLRLEQNQRVQLIERHRFCLSLHDDGTILDGEERPLPMPLPPLLSPAAKC